jgi:hypothetical protein
LEKVDQLGTKSFTLRIEQKFKDSIQQSAACQGNKTLLAFNETPPALGGTILWILLGFILFMNRKIINQIYFTNGNIRDSFLFVGFYSSHHELAYNYNILLFNPLVLLYFWFTDNKKWIYNFSLFNLLSLVVYLFMMMNKAHLLIVSPLIITSGVVLVRLALKTKKKLRLLFK